MVSFWDFWSFEWVRSKLDGQKRTVHFHPKRPLSFDLLGRSTSWTVHFRRPSTYIFWPSRLTTMNRLRRPKTVYFNSRPSTSSQDHSLKTWPFLISAKAGSRCSRFQSSPVGSELDRRKRSWSVDPSWSMEFYLDDQFMLR